MQVYIFMWYGVTCFKKGGAMAKCNSLWQRRGGRVSKILKKHVTSFMKSPLWNEHNNYHNDDLYKIYSLKWFIILSTHLIFFFTDMHNLQILLNFIVRYWYVYLLFLFTSLIITSTKSPGPSLWRTSTFEL